MKHIFFLLALCSALISCSDDQLHQVVWQPDPSNHSLPVYSEWGYNTYGAIVNGRPFSSPRASYSSARNGRPVCFAYSADSLLFSMRHASSFDFDKSVVGISFRFPSAVMTDYSDLASLDGQSFDLAHCFVSLSLAGASGNDSVSVSVTRQVSVSAGRLVFRRVQIVYVDEHREEAILSGTFSFHATDGNDVYDVADGRFDIGVDNYRLFGLDDD